MKTKNLKNEKVKKESGTIYTLHDLAEMFQVTIRTIYNWMDDNRFSFVKVGSKTYLTEQQLQEFLTNHEVKSFKAGRNL
ncbi:MAG: helix-turn-helix domain-containing protein [Bacteroidetes bacterium]|nr:helix-turn-helix domain-containing protein [Bacteroidota bacterium]